MDKDTIELIIKEMLEEQKIANKINTDLISATNQLTAKVNDIRERLDNHEIVTPHADTKPVEEAIRKGLDQIQLTVAAQPKSVTKKFQILLFPEQDARLFYKIVFGRWFMWLVIMLFLTNLYKWLLHDSDNRKEVQIKMVESNEIGKAWNHLYRVQDREGKRRMDSALMATVKKQ